MSVGLCQRAEKTPWDWPNKGVSGSHSAPPAPPPPLHHPAIQKAPTQATTCLHKGICLHLPTLLYFMINKYPINSQRNVWNLTTSNSQSLAKVYPCETALCVVRQLTAPVAKARGAACPNLPSNSYGVWSEGKRDGMERLRRVQEVRKWQVASTS